MKKALLFSACFLLFTFPGKPQTINIDGTFFDWNPSTQIDVPPNYVETTFAEGDETDPPRGNTDPSYFADLDIQDVYVTQDDDNIYVRVTMNPIGSVDNIPNDTSYHGGASITTYISVDPGEHDTTGLTWGWWQSGYDFYMQSYPDDSAFFQKTGYEGAVYEHLQDGTGWDFEIADTTRGGRIAWNASRNEVEMSIPKDIIFHPKHLSLKGTPDSIAILIYTNEWNGPWRSDYAPVAGGPGYMFKIKSTPAINIDGTFFDWDPSTQIDVPPNYVETTFAEGDETDPPRGNTDPSYFADLDIQDVYATQDDDNLYVRVTMNPIGSVDNIPNDTSYHGGASITTYISVDPGEHDTTGLTWGWWQSGYDFYMQSYPDDSAFIQKTGYEGAVYEHLQDGTGWDFEIADTTRGGRIAWNASRNEVEMSIPKDIIFHPKHLSLTGTPDSIAILIYTNEWNGPWRSDYAPVAGGPGYMFKIKNSVTGVETFNNIIPNKFLLKQNYPNPFNPTTTISYDLPEAGLVNLAVFNILGEKVATIESEYRSAGNYKVKFDARNLSSGVYFYSIEVNNYREARKMIILK